MFKEISKTASDQHPGLIRYVTIGGVAISIIPAVGSGLPLVIPAVSD